MFKKDRKARDAFTFSLGGMTTVTPFVAMPMVADDRINKVRDERLRQARNTRDKKPRGWLYRHRQAAQDCA